MLNSKYQLGKILYYIVYYVDRTGESIVIKTFYTSLLITNTTDKIKLFAPTYSY